MKKRLKKKPKIIKANQILVEDLAGRPRILMEATGGKAGPSITLFSKTGGAVSISINDDNHGVFAIHHADGKTGACLGVKADGQSGLELHDNNGAPSITLHSKSKNQKPAIEIRTGKGKTSTFA
jgi:hypothetical protein